MPVGVPNFYVTSTTATNVGLAWSEPQGPSDSFRIQISTDDDSYNRAVEVDPLQDLEYLVQGLQPHTMYRFSIANIVNGRPSMESHAVATTNEGSK